MAKRSIRVVLTEDSFLKFKVYCAIENITMTDMTNKIVNKFIKETEEQIRVVKLPLKPI